MKLRQLLFKAMGSGSGLLLATSASFLASALLSRSLSPSAYGTIIVAMSVATIISQIAQLGFLRTSTRLVAEYRMRRDLARLKSFLVFSFLAVTISAAVASLVVGELFSLMYSEKASGVPRAALLAGLLVWPFAISRIASGVLLGLQNPLFGSFFQSGMPNLGILVSVTFTMLVLGPGFEAYSTQVILLGAYAATIAGLILILPGVADLRDVRLAPFTPGRWLSISLPLMILGTMQIVNKQASVLVIGAMGDATDVARFFPAFRICELATFGLFAVNAVIAPHIAEASSTGDRQKLQSTLHTAAILSLGSTIILVPAILLFQDVLFSLFGGIAQEGRTVLIILLVGQVVNSVAGSVGILMAMSGQGKFAALVSTVITLSLLLTQPIFVYFLGIEGAALGIATSSIMWNCILIVRAKNKLGVNPTVFSRSTIGNE